MTFVEMIGAALMIAGAVLSALAAWGIVDFDTPLARMHAATKSASLGLAMLTLGAGVAAGSWGLIGAAVLVTAFLFVTAPISGHMLGRAAYAAGQVVTVVHDDLRSCDAAPSRLPRSRSPRVYWSRVALLAGVWVLLWRDASAGVWMGGILVASSLELVRATAARGARIRPLGMLRFLGSYLVRVIASNLRVAWEVLTPSNEQIREAIVAVPLQTSSASVALLVANAISFTPGSLTIELTVDPFVLYVHVLHFENVEQVRAEVAGLESLAAGAIATQAVVSG